MMRILIADDEPIARQILAELLAELETVQLVGQAANGLEAVELAARLKPDVVLLDLEMPGLDGFGVARSLAAAALPVVIFVTAFEEHALRAFDAGAIDYLLKPVRRERLEAALDKARPRVEALQPPTPPKLELRRIVGRAASDLHLLDPDDIVAFQAEGDAVVILTRQGRFYSDHTLKALESRLDPARFRRIHRSTIINTDHIRRISPLSSKRWLLQMSGGLEVTVSKRLAGLIRDATGW